MEYKKLIKLSNAHYIICDDSEIKENDLCYDKEGNPGHNNTLFVVKCLRTAPDSYWNKFCKKITHSFGIELEGVINKPLSEVEEAIYGYSIEKMADEYSKKVNGKYCDDLYPNCDQTLYEISYNDYKAGFNAHKELVKDKLFTIEQLNEAMEIGFEIGRNIDEDNPSIGLALLQHQKDKLTSASQTEWDIEIENNKIKVI